MKNVLNRSISTLDLLQVYEKGSEGVYDTPLTTKELTDVYNELSFIATVCRTSSRWRKHELLETMIVSRDYVISTLIRVNINPLTEPEKSIQYFTDHPVPHFGRATVRNAAIDTPSQSGATSSVSRSQSAVLSTDVTRKIEEMSRQVRELHEARGLSDTSNSDIIALRQELDDAVKDNQRLKKAIRVLLDNIPVEKRTELVISLVLDG